MNYFDPLTNILLYEWAPFDIRTKQHAIRKFFLRQRNCWIFPHMCYHSETFIYINCWLKCGVHTVDHLPPNDNWRFKRHFNVFGMRCKPLLRFHVIISEKKICPKWRPWALVIKSSSYILISFIIWENWSKVTGTRSKNEVSKYWFIKYN